MAEDRVFKWAEYLKPNEATDEPIRSIVSLTPEAKVQAWTVAPGQRLPTHKHPTGQEVWTVLSGKGQYVVDASETTTPIAAGDIVVARTGEWHGVLNTGDVPLVFISLVSPSDAGNEKL